MLLVWLAIHPTLQARLLADHHGMAEGVRRSPTLEILAKTILSSLNLESIPRPQELNGVKVAQVLVSSAALGLGTVVAARKRQSDRRTGSDDPGRRNLARFAMLWMVVGWFPLFLPSIDWHA